MGVIHKKFMKDTIASSSKDDKKVVSATSKDNTITVEFKILTSEDLKSSRNSAYQYILP